jgi:hypothetical protein
VKYDTSDLIADAEIMMHLQALQEADDLAQEDA